MALLLRNVCVCKLKSSRYIPKGKFLPAVTRLVLTLLLFRAKERKGLCPFFYSQEKRHLAGVLVDDVGVIPT